ncbi:MAG: transposase [Paracoccaceae bacterium]
MHLTPGQTADITAAPELLALGEAQPRELLADKGYDADSLRAELYLRGARPIIPWKSNRKAPGTLDRRRYARRNCIERMMGLLKQFRRVATRYDKTAESFLGFVQLAAIHRWMRFVRTA